ncbi:MAG: hypothetical protein ACQER1_18675, partial [Armatimonadota bacterium]
TAEGWFDDPKSHMRWHKIHKERGNTPLQLWEKLMSRHANIMIVQCGDQSRTQAMRRAARGEHGNIVQQLLFDYGGGRNIRLLRFTPAENRIDVITWDTQAEKLVEASKHVQDRKQWQHVIRYDLGGASGARACEAHPPLKWVGRPMVR